MEILIQGFITGICLAVAIGAQSTFVLKQGLTKQYLLMTVIICWLADSLLFSLGVLGMSSVIISSPAILSIMTWLAVIFLIGYGISSFINAFRVQSLKMKPSGVNISRTKTVIMLLVVTFLNPHVYMDSLVIMAGITAGFSFSSKILFVLGAILATLVWFSTLVYGASKFAPLLNKPVTQRLISVIIGLLMFWIAWSLI